MYTLMSFVIPFVLIHHGFNSIVLKIISEIKSGLKYWRETSNKIGPSAPSAAVEGAGGVRSTQRS